MRREVAIGVEASDNPFAVVIMAHRKTQDTAQDAQGRLRWKLHLVKGLYAPATAGKIS